MKNLDSSNEAYVMVPMGVLVEMRETLVFLKSKADENNSIPKLNNWITEKQAMQLLDKKETWFWTMRNSGELPFSKVGGTVFYELADIEKLIARNKRSAA